MWGRDGVFEDNHAFGMVGECSNEIFTRALWKSCPSTHNEALLLSLSPHTQRNVTQRKRVSLRIVREKTPILFALKRKPGSYIYIHIYTHTFILVRTTVPFESEYKNAKATENRREWQRCWLVNQCSSLKKKSHKCWTQFTSSVEIQSYSRVAIVTPIKCNPHLYENEWKTTGLSSV